jgi:hypothetical protein
MLDHGTDLLLVNLLLNNKSTMRRVSGSISFWNALINRSI